MKRLAIALSLIVTACGTDSKDSGVNLVAAEPETKTETVTPTPDETAVEPTPEPEPIPDGSPASGPVVVSSQFKKFQFAESDCSADGCTVRIKPEQACNATDYTMVNLIPYQLKEGFLYQAASLYYITDEWRNGDVVTIKISKNLTKDPNGYASGGYQEQSGVFYNCPN